MTDSEVLDFLVQGLPPGTLDAWDFAPNPAEPDLYEEWLALAQSVKAFVVDRIDALRRERNPAAAAEKLQDFELALGLQYSSTATFGTVQQRQAQVVGRFRETAGLTRAGLQTVMQAYLQYADPSQIQIIEPNRAALRVQHSYLFVAPAALGTSTTIDLAMPGGEVPDRAYVSDMGAQLRVNVQVAGSGSSGIIELHSPEGVVKSWALDDYRPLSVVVAGNAVFNLQLYAPEFGPQLVDGIHYVRRQVGGAWKLVIKNMDQLNSASLFVEGVGRDPAPGADGLGAALFEWGVLAESAKLGAGADLAGAEAAIARMNHCHLRGFLIRDGGMTMAAIPDDPGAIPDASIPG